MQSIARAEIPATTAVQVTDLTVRYYVAEDRIRSFKEFALHYVRHGLRRREIIALDSVSFSVSAGEVFGVIGRNGAGKSTLLKVLSRVVTPTEGRVVVRGKVAPLLELGAGFHPDLSGRENIFLNGALLGYGRGVLQANFDRILEFSELEDFVDVPLRNYSSGMTARLGFSIATLFRPDILILDEILAVGDAGFQERCLRRIEAFREQGSTVLLVSHDLDLVKTFCDHAVWIEQGKVAAAGDPADVVGSLRGQPSPTGPSLL